MRHILLALLLACLACGGDTKTRPEAATNTPSATPDAQHQGVMGPHGDHTPHHGGLVLMQGDVHYEVVLSKDGRHQVWFSDAMRNELPASVAAGVIMEIVRPGETPESVRMAIDDAGEAWVANGRPLSGEGITVKLRYSLQDTPHEIELPFVPGVNGPA